MIAISCLAACLFAIAIGSIVESQHDEFQIRARRNKRALKRELARMRGR